LEATEAALRVAMDTGEIEEYRRIKAARDSILAKITTEPEMASGPETVPISEKEARLFFRKRAREIVRIASSPGDLTLKAVYDKVGASLGFDPKKGFAARDLFPRELGSKLDEVKTAVEAEIELRCLLRAAEIKEGALKGMDRSSAAETFVNDMKANNVPVLERSHYKWLRGVDARGVARGIDSLGEEGAEALTTQKIDRVFSILLLMGEKDPKFDQPWQKEFEKYRLFKINPNTRRPENNQSLKKNYYDTGYPEVNRTLVEDDLRTRFGNDAYTIAHQIFAAYKEEARFTWTHYLNRYFSFDGSRNAAANLAKRIYVGCSRVFTEGFRTIIYKKDDGTEVEYDETKGNLRAVEREETLSGGVTVKRIYITLEGESKPRLAKIKGYIGELKGLALSPLTVKGVEAKIDDPLTGDQVDKLKQGLYHERALRGRFLADTPFEDTDYVADNKMPQAVSLTVLKDGEDVRKSIIAIGELGKTGEKVSRIETALATIATLRNTLVSLVEAGAVKQADADSQMETESLNSLWALSIQNPENVADLGHQTKAKTSFLPPSKINTLFEGLGGRIQGVYYLATDVAYQRFGSIAQATKEATMVILKSKKLPEPTDNTDVLALLSAEEKATKLKLPSIRGGVAMAGFAAAAERSLRDSARITNALGRALHGERYKPTER